MALVKNRLYVAEKYINVANILLDKMIISKNFIIFDHEALENENKEKTKFSSFNVILPCLFCLYQGIELILKGFISIKQSIEKIHKLELLLPMFENLYCDHIELINVFKTLINNPIDLIKKFKEKNKINTTSEFYNSLRYPDKESEFCDYSLLLHPMNDSKLNSQIKVLKKDIESLMELSSKLLIQLENESINNENTN